MAIDDCAKAGEVRATAMTVASASRFMAFSTATGASFCRKYYADGIPRAAPGMRGTIRSGSLAAYFSGGLRGRRRAVHHHRDWRQSASRQLVRRRHLDLLA